MTCVAQQLREGMVPPVHGSTQSLTLACSRRLPAYAPTSLRLPGAAEARR